jgi:hypothetical protein
MITRAHILAMYERAVAEAEAAARH